MMALGGMTYPIKIEQIVRKMKILSYVNIVFSCFNCFLLFTLRMGKREINCTNYKSPKKINEK